MFLIVQLLLFGASYQKNVFLKYDAILSIAECRQKPAQQKKWQRRGHFVSSGAILGSSSV